MLGIPNPKPKVYPAGKIIRAWRVSVGLSLRELAYRSQLSCVLVGEIERQVTIPSKQVESDIIEVIADETERKINGFVGKFEVDTDQLATWQGDLGSVNELLEQQLEQAQKKGPC